LTFTPVSWGNVKEQIGADYYTNQILIDRDPNSVLGFNAIATSSGILDQAAEVTRNLTSQTTLNINPHTLRDHFTLSGFAGNAIYDQDDNTDALTGRGYLDPNFVSINNT
jgi:hypothetical protein